MGKSKTEAMYRGPGSAGLVGQPMKSDEETVAAVWLWDDSDGWVAATTCVSGTTGWVFCREVSEPARYWQKRTNGLYLRDVALHGADRPDGGG